MREVEVLKSENEKLKMKINELKLKLRVSLIEEERPKNRQTQEWWDERIPRILDLIRSGYGLKEIAYIYGSTRICLSGILHRRGISALVVKHCHKNNKPFTYSGSVK